MNHLKMSQNYAENTCSNTEALEAIKEPKPVELMPVELMPVESMPDKGPISVEPMPAEPMPVKPCKERLQAPKPPKIIAKQPQVKAHCDYYKYDCLNRGCHKCNCYRRDSTDTRCCGLCYFCCPAKHISRHIDHVRCDFCPESFQEYLESGYFKTINGPAVNNDDACFCTCICLPFKFPIFFPCFLGSLFNNICNNCCCAFSGKDRNYLC